MQAVTNFKYKMLCPFKTEDIEIEVNLELCTVYKGIPYGPAIIHCK